MILLFIYEHWLYYLGRSGSYDLAEAEGVQRGTKIVIHLRGECYDYSKEKLIKGNNLYN